MSEDMDPVVEARTMGWVPKEEFRGDPSRWVEADVFLERGRTVMPILKKNNEHLEKLVKQQREEMDKLRSMFSASQESIQELQKVHVDATKAAVAKARRDLMNELKEAKQTGDVDREIEITEELDELRTRAKEFEKEPVKPEPVKPEPAKAKEDDGVHPDFAAWQAENKWFGTDERRTMRAVGIAQELRSDPAYDNVQGMAFFTKVVEVMEERAGGSTGTGKVSSGRPTSGTGTSTIKGYADLPAEAKAVCDRQATRLVGEGRAFKTQDEWRKYYVNLYQQGE